MYMAESGSIIPWRSAEAIDRAVEAERIETIMKQAREVAGGLDCNDIWEIACIVWTSLHIALWIDEL